jgi:hypothetical protein
MKCDEPSVALDTLMVRIVGDLCLSEQIHTESVKFW